MAAKINPNSELLIVRLRKGQKPAVASEAARLGLTIQEYLRTVIDGATTNPTTP